MGERRAMSKQMNVAAEELGVWVYAITRADGAVQRAAGLRGVADEPVRAVVGGDLAAIVGTVRLEDFRGAGLRRNLADAAAFAPKARAHNAIVGAFRRGGPVIPVRLGTIYRDDRRVCQLLLNEHEDMVTALRRVSGREELGVKAYTDPKSLAIQGDLIGSASPDSLARVPYLLRRRRQLAAQDEGYRLATAEADRVHSVLLRCAVDGKRKTPIDENPSSKGPWTLLNGSYLVDGDVVELFMQTVTALERSTARIRLEVTGPWPPYSFADDLIAI
jgi:gas vesicle protein GvpL/GvpF